MQANAHIKIHRLRPSLGCITAADKLVFLRSEFYPQTYSAEPPIQDFKERGRCDLRVPTVLQVQAHLSKAKVQVDYALVGYLRQGERAAIPLSPQGDSPLAA